ncbi:2TM domain-containing protein [Massilia sp. W12]|uniref:2TM domain-containing protein n=1 Tax=Massilia sp. W12 TaxID=3126507 RepID=UPI0030D62571
MMQTAAFPPAPNAVAAGPASLEFYGHAMTYLLVMTLLGWINLFLSPESFWSLWPLLGWGLGLFRHGVKTFWPPLKQSLRNHMSAHELARFGPF